ncbi:aminotransferase class I/II-fold pyridoxal phosphate-dependent enzyme [Nitrospirillum sp. BR 11828]|uniref:aminotransferase class I/II-fold pyridoxal phosphate-dependent enzyme n=1 Tax=Nitrospirillum sp. BR 11828 TaxID=3104325 RepID=UPI002ACADD3E|nr:aminotransferase class I/II-fold pyridoxal phosphate-dependent enzyme [Nitrospirillum sp. BR 11828]MDZ5648564.1 aminotransferase class I/II-fold pyridoxal phosphate-dependent enzyme [Nitrospirillum sp. BR 11828]
MDFMEFLAWERQAVADRPDVLRLTETRIAEAFTLLRPRAEVPDTFPTVHRCHMAQLWRAVRGLPAEGARETLVCRGVRHALGLLLRRYAGQGRRLLLPGDVYPVYGRIAAAAGLPTTSFGLFPDFDAVAVFQAAEAARADIVLLPAPLKLHGRDWTTAEARVARDWLAGASSRRLLLDGVYSFGGPLAPTVLDLMATGQAIYLDSLSKGWLTAQVFGVAIVPESDFTSHAGDFRQDPPSQAELFRARSIMTDHDGLPERLRQMLAERRAAVTGQLAAAGIRAHAPRQGYLIPVEGAAPALLERHGVLAIPLSVFGGGRPGWSIASALPIAVTP